MIGMKAIIRTALGVWIAGGLGTASILLEDTSTPSPPRILRLQVLGDADFRSVPDWKDKAADVVSRSSRAFESTFGIVFDIGKFSDWTPDKRLTSLEDLAFALESEVGTAGFDVVLAVIGRKNLDRDYFGFSMFREGLVLLRASGSVEDQVRALSHEIAHLFGAVHLDDPRSLMDFRGRGSSFDTLTRRLISLNKSRTFGGREFPLPRSHWQACVDLYRTIIRNIERRSTAGNAAGRSVGIRGRPALSLEGLEDVFLALANIALELKDYKDVETLCRRALALNPGSLEARNLGAIALRRQGYPERAVPEYLAILEKRPGHAKVRYNLGIAYARMGEWEAALDAYAAAVEINPRSAEAFCNMGEVLMRLGRLDEAEAALRRALAIDPQDVLALCNTAEIHFRRGDFDAARSLAENLAANHPERPEPLNILGNIFHAEGEREAARNAFSAAVRADPDYEKAHYNLGNILDAEGRLEEAAASFRRAVELNGGFAEARAALGAGLLRLNRPDEALAELDRAAALGLRSPALHLNRGSALLETGDPDAAEGEFRRVLDEAPGSAEAMNNLGIVYLRKENPSAALKAFQAAADMDPENREVQVNLGNVLLAMEQWEKALRHYEAAAAADPTDAVLHNNMAFAFYKIGEFGRALRHAEKAEALGLRVHPDFMRLLKEKMNRHFSDSADPVS
jgi:tetratricopeptide (TPR) repeat protein